MTTIHLTYEIKLAKDKNASWVQLAKKGKFFHQRYGNFTFNQRSFDQVINNFSNKLAVNIEHLAFLQILEGAETWLTKVELQNDGEELWGYVEFGKTHAEQVRKGKIKYTSIEFSSHALDDKGKMVGYKLNGLALTNDPFLEGMAEIKLSKTVEYQDLDEPETDPSPEIKPMPDEIKLSKVDHDELVRKAALADDPTKVVINLSEYDSLKSSQKEKSRIELSARVDAVLKGHEAKGRIQPSSSPGVKEKILASADSEAALKNFDDAYSGIPDNSVVNLTQPTGNSGGNDGETADDIGKWIEDKLEKKLYPKREDAEDAAFTKFGRDQFNSWRLNVVNSSD